jgi:hypothetical protein
VNQPNIDGDTALFSAGLGIEAVVWCLVTDCETMNQTKNTGGTPLMVATLQGHSKIVKFLRRLPGTVFDSAVQINNVKHTAVDMAALSLDAKLIK